MNDIIVKNALKDANYCPYCLRCSGLVRMKKVATLLWECHCGAIHDARIPAVPIEITQGEQDGKPILRQDNNG